MQTSHLNTSGVGAEMTVRSSNVLIVGGKRSGEYVKWFGNRVTIDGAPHVLHRAYFTDGVPRQYYVLDGFALSGAMQDGMVERIEVAG